MSPHHFKADCLVTLLKTNVTFNIVSATDCTKLWLKEKSKAPYEFGDNIDYPYDEYRFNRDKTSRKYVPLDNYEFKL